MDFFAIDNLLTLLMLIFLQAVLGFDNLLYISIESKRVPEEHQPFVRRMGIGLAIGLRILLLFVIVAAIDSFQEPFLSTHWGWFEAEVNVHALIVLAGGVFIIYTALKEIMHMLTMHDIDGHPEDGPRNSVGKAITWIVVMNLVFSFDSILSAIALTDNFWTMAIAIVLSGLMMIFLADHVSEFLKKNRLYEVLGLFILFIVGIMLVSEGGHLAHLEFFGFPIEPMAKSTFYFIIAILVIVDVIQGRYQQKLMIEQEREATRAAACAVDE
jgi:predicted tellurium resistance membrane protein TerC